MAWFTHVIFHILCLKFLVPALGGKKTDAPDDHAGKTFQATCEEIACSWFTSNPVHCLRSKYIHKHSPHCMFWVSGKEHLQERNDSIHCYFHDEEAAAEDFSKANLGLSSISKRVFGRKEKPTEE